MKTPRFPVSIRRGSVITKIYRMTRGDGREIFTAAWHAGGVRRTRQFPSYVEAHAEASMKADQLAAGRIDAAATLTGDDGAALAEARKLCGDTPLLSAVREWAQARALTAGNVLGAAKFWAAKNGKVARHVPVADVVKQFLKAKTAAGQNVAKDHAHTFGRIVADLGQFTIDSVTSRQLAAWLAQTENPISRNTQRKRLVAIWRWAQRQAYLPRDGRTEAEMTDRAHEPAPVIGIIDVKAWATLLAHFRAKSPALLAPLVLAGFCGLRRAEIHAQTWEDVSLDRKNLRVTKGKRGTPARRMVPLCDAAISWIRECPGEMKGPICEGVALDRIRLLAKEAGFSLPENCFRHSYISHAVAGTGDIPRVSLDAGNSPKEINRHYRELVSEADGKAWFAITPGDSEVIVPSSASAGGVT